MVLLGLGLGLSAPMCKIIRLLARLVTPTQVTSRTKLNKYTNSPPILKTKTPRSRPPPRLKFTLPGLLAAVGVCLCSTNATITWDGGHDIVYYTGVTSRYRYMSPPIPLSQSPPVTSVQADNENARETPPTPLASMASYSSNLRCISIKVDFHRCVIPDTPSSTSTVSPMKWDEDTQVDHPLPPTPTASQPTGTWQDSLRAG
jgi:hypothetical protein